MTIYFTLAYILLLLPYYYLYYFESLTTTTTTTTTAALKVLLKLSVYNDDIIQPFTVNNNAKIIKMFKSSIWYFISIW